MQTFDVLVKENFKNWEIYLTAERVQLSGKTFLSSPFDRYNPIDDEEAMIAFLFSGNNYSIAAYGKPELPSRSSQRHFSGITSVSTLAWLTAILIDQCPGDVPFKVKSIVGTRVVHVFCGLCKRKWMELGNTTQIVFKLKYPDEEFIWVHHLCKRESMHEINVIDKSECEFYLFLQLLVQYNLLAIEKGIGKIKERRKYKSIITIAQHLLDRITYTSEFELNNLLDKQINSDFIFVVPKSKLELYWNLFKKIMQTSSWKFAYKKLSGPLFSGHVKGLYFIGGMHPRQQKVLDLMKTLMSSGLYWFWNNSFLLNPNNKIDDTDTTVRPLSLFRSDIILIFYMLLILLMVSGISFALEFIFNQIWGKK
ncbi:unnamed protein product [Allacma fusca]|uniref:Uncharacterized protein n=1 Tax=Allacma fusca TaxID=39272 RepID=A0A8J2PAW1_9HEXA|nr:unnamed protein product [Allacma fusca]